MLWITRERPKIDRIACPWLVSRFVDTKAQFLFVPTAQVMSQANALRAIPFDVPGVELTHVGDRCSFDAILAKYRLSTHGLARLAAIVRGADTDSLHLAPECAGLLAVSLGLSTVIADDHELLRLGMRIYDGLFAFCQLEPAEPHAWPPVST